MLSYLGRHSWSECRVRCMRVHSTLSPSLKLSIAARRKLVAPIEGRPATILKPERCAETTEALRNLRDPLWSRLVAETSGVCWTNGTFLRKANAAVEVGFADSTQSAEKLCTRGSGEADED